MFRSLTIFSLFAFLCMHISASPTAVIPLGGLQRRTDPYFPDTPASCPICAKDYDNINGCAMACPVLANFSMIIFNPGAFIDVIRCACTDTFQAVFPQCVDCFVQTNQTDVLDTNTNLPSIVDGMRQVCGLESALLGNVSGADNYTTASATPTPTASATSGGILRLGGGGDLSFGSTLSFIGLAVFMGLLGL